MISSAQWSAVYCTVQGSGGPSWLLGVGPSARMGQSGSFAVLGPLILAPGQKARLQALGAQAGSTPAAAFWGWLGSAPDGSDLAALFSNVESVGSLNLIGNVPVVNPPGGQLLTYNAQRALVTNWQIPLSGANASQAVALDPGCRSLAFTFASGNGGGSPTNLGSIQVIGNNTGVDYAYQLTGPQYANVANIPSTTLYVEVIYAQDTSVNVIIGTTAAAGSVKTTITEIFDDEVITPNNQQPAQVVIMARNGSQTVGVDSVAGALYTVLRGAGPPWLTPNRLVATINTGSMGSGATVNLLTGLTAGLNIYLHGMLLMTPTAGATWCALQDGAGVEIARFDESNQKGQFADFKGGQFGAIPAAPNNVLKLFNGGVANTFWNGFVTYSVGA